MERNYHIFGVICEYNPFHNGHAYHLTQMRTQGATHIVAVMSGNFVQRGEPALVSKRLRTLWALQNGADLVLELPLPWAMSGAETFARGGVGLLHSLGCVEAISFGSEHADASLFSHTAAQLLSTDFSAALTTPLASGMSFAQARETALNQTAGEECATLLRTPNDILGVEYAKAALQMNSSLRLCPILRSGANHHDSLPETGAIASASSVRAALRERGTAESVSPFLPKSVSDGLNSALRTGEAPSSLQHLERAILACWRTLSPEAAAQLPDVSEGIENRILTCARTATSLDDLFAQVKSKRYSHARIRRIVLSAFLGLTAADSAGIPPYLRILGLNGALRKRSIIIKFCSSCI